MQAIRFQIKPGNQPALEQFCEETHLSPGDAINLILRLSTDRVLCGFRQISSGEHPVSIDDLNH